MTTTAKKQQSPKTKDLGFRPLIGPKNKRKPRVHKFANYEIEKRYLMMTPEEDFTKKKNGLSVYHEVLQDGNPIEQGYIRDMMIAKGMLDDLGIELSEEFKPNTVRLRKYKGEFILTLKDRKETKKRELEFTLTRSEFRKYWPETEGSRVFKKRLEKERKGYLTEIDAFTDRFLLISEIEVAKEEDLEVIPKWGQDVTNNSQWSNKALAK